MREQLGAGGWRSWLVAALAAAAVGCDGGGGAGNDAGPDGSTDADADADADTDADADAGPDGGGFACEIDADRVFADVTYFASEALAGREPGTEGNELALQAGEALFAALGLEPVGDDGGYRQAFTFQQQQLLADPEAAVDGEPLDWDDDFSMLSGSGSAAVTAEMVYVGYGMTVPPFDAGEYPECPLPAGGYDDYAGVDVTGKIVVVLRHGPDDDDSVPDTCPANAACASEPCLWNFGYKAANAAAHGAAAMILVQNYANPSEHMDGTLGPEYAGALAAVFVDRNIVAAAVPEMDTWTTGIDDALAGDPHETGVEATVTIETEIVDVETANLLGAILGTDPEMGDEVVVVGGHIDHLGVDTATGDVYYGADDNASGSSVTMELARLATHCATPARTILFALWNAEELGLLGSIHYVQDPAFPIGDTIAAYSVDMVGTGQDTNLVLYGVAEEENEWLGLVMEGSAADMGYGWAVTPGAETGNSDHYPFAYLGVPAVCAMSGPLETHPYYHTPDDTIDNVGPSYVGMAASMMWAGIKPIVEGTEQEYLTSGKALSRAPVRVDPNSRWFRDR